MRIIPEAITASQEYMLSRIKMLFNVLSWEELYYISPDS